MAAFPGQPG